MVGDTVLGKIVRANLVAAVAAADHLAPGVGDFRLLFGAFHFEQTRAQHFEGLGLVFELGFFILALHDQTGRNMRHAHRRIGGVHALAAGAGGAKYVDAQVVHINVDVNFFGFGEHGDTGGGGVNAAVLLGGRHALDAMHPAFVFEFAESVLPAHLKNNFFEAADALPIAGYHVRVPSLPLCEARIHPE